MIGSGVGYVSSGLVTTGAVNGIPICQNLIDLSLDDEMREEENVREVMLNLGSLTCLMACALWLHCIMAPLEGSQVDSHMIICHISNMGNVAYMLVYIPY